MLGRDVLRAEQTEQRRVREECGLLRVSGFGHGSNVGIPRFKCAVRQRLAVGGSVVPTAFHASRPVPRNHPNTPGLAHEHDFVGIGSGHAGA